ncbi:MAG: RepB family DNA primase, partial [Phycisphaerales bacterium]|nr:RepB family DNA primase [Phycisphaerales bacterium]
QHNIIARPKGATVELVQLDDLIPAGLERVRTVAFLILATSPENYQAWVAVRECDADLARRLRRGSGADQSDRPDVSRADFTFCLLAIDWGWSVADTCARLLEESSKARENGKAYAWLTAQRAAAAIARRERGWTE